MRVPYFLKDDELDAKTREELGVRFNCIMLVLRDYFDLPEDELVRKAEDALRDAGVPQPGDEINPAFVAGYDQSAKDIIARIREFVRNMDKPIITKDGMLYFLSELEKEYE